MQYWGDVYVPDNDTLRVRINQEYHVTTLPGHRGRVKTSDLLDREYYKMDTQRMLTAMYGVDMGAISLGVPNIQPLESFDFCLSKIGAGRI